MNTNAGNTQNRNAVRSNRAYYEGQIAGTDAPTQNIKPLHQSPRGKKDNKDKKRFRIAERVARVTFHNKKNGYVVLKTKNIKNNSLPEKTLVGIYPGDDAKKELTGVSVTFSGFMGNDIKYGKQYEFTHMSVNESGLFYFLAKMVKGISAGLASELINHYGEEKLEEIIDKNPRQLLKHKGIAEKRLKMILNSWKKHKELKSVSDLLTPAGASMDIIWNVFYESKEDPGFLDKIKANPYEALTSLRGIGFKRADRVARGMGVDVNSIFRVKACIGYVLREIAERDGHSLLRRGDLFNLVSEELAIVNQGIREEAKEAEDIAAHMQGKLLSDHGDDDNEFDEFEVPDIVAVGDELHITQELFDQAIEEMSKEKDKWGRNKIFIIGEERSVALGYLKYCEENIINDLRIRASSLTAPLVRDIEVFISKQEEKMGISFSGEQKAAIRQANSGCKSMVICGYAGTGKSTIAKAILDLLSMRYGRDSIICCALSGIAADRIRKTSGYDSSTIHSLLGLNADSDEEESNTKVKDRAKYGVVLVDESSMINSELMNSLLRKIPGDAHVVLMGDPAQLPPIGAGNPFSDIVDHDVIPVIKLETIYRQNEDQALTRIAGEIRQNKIPENYSRNRFSDFFFVTKEVEDYYKNKKKMETGEITKDEFDVMKDKARQEALNTIKNLARKAKIRIDEAIESGDVTKRISFFQVISPIKGGLLGTRNLNMELREILNPLPVESGAPPSVVPETFPAKTPACASIEETKAKDEEEEVKEPPFMRVSDKVVHVRNTDLPTFTPEMIKRHGFDLDPNLGKARRIYNGMLGTVAHVDPETETIFVHFPVDGLFAKYDKTDALNLLEHAYALTVHKVQGSEFDVVSMPVIQAHYNMLNNKLLYTAITRAKDKAICVGETYAFNIACRKKTDIIRNTVMKKLLLMEKKQAPGMFLDDDTLSMPAMGGMVSGIS